MLLSLPASAQDAGHQMPNAASSAAASASPSLCAQSSQGVSRLIDALTGRIDEARQTNDAAKLRAAVADLQVALAQMKTQLADCTSLTQAGSGATGSMPGMDHSKMQMAPGTPVMQPGSSSPAPGAAGRAPAMAGMDHSKMTGMDHSKMTGTNQPNTSGAGQSQMAGMDHSKMPMAPKSAKASGSGASAKRAQPGAAAAGMDHSKMAGAPPAQTGATEPAKMAGMDHSKMAGEKTASGAAEAPSKTAQPNALVFTLRTDPAPPRNGKNDFEVNLKDAEGKPIADAEVSLEFSMSAMPSMKTPDVRLTSAGNGSYKGRANLGMAGDWDVTVKASRNGQQLDVKKMRLTAK
jgi:hypothetical protein